MAEEKQSKPVKKNCVHVAPLIKEARKIMAQIGMGYKRINDETMIGDLYIPNFYDATGRGLTGFNDRLKKASKSLKISISNTDLVWEVAQKLKDLEESKTKKEEISHSN